MADYEAIGAALVGYYGTATPPSGETAIRHYTDDAPNQAGMLPAAYAFLGEGEYEWGPSLTKYVTVEIVVQVLFGQDGDLPRRKRRLTKWRGALEEVVVEQHIQLGISGIDWCVLASVTDGTVDYGGTQYDLIELTHQVRIREQVSAVA